MIERQYTIFIYPDGDAYSVLVPALPGCVTFGRDPEHAAVMAKQAIELWLEHLQDRGEQAPDDVVEGPVVATTVSAQMPTGATA